MFVHFLSDQIQRLHGFEERFTPTHRDAVAGRLLWCAATFATAPIVIPTVDLVQSPAISPALPFLSALSEAGLVEFVGSATSIDELLRRKAVHFRGTGLYREWEDPDASRRIAPFAAALSTRSRNTTNDMLGKWQEDARSLAGPSKRSLLTASGQSYGSAQLRQAYNLLPDNVRWSAYVDATLDLPWRLRDFAFLWSVVRRVGAFRVQDGYAKSAFERALAHYWVLSHVEEYDLPIIGRLRGVGWIDCGLRHTKPGSVFDLVTMERLLRQLSLAPLLEPGRPEDLLWLRLDPLGVTAMCSVLLVWYEDLRGDGQTQRRAVDAVRRLSGRCADAAQRLRYWPAAREAIFRILVDYVADPPRSLADPLPRAKEAPISLLSTTEVIGRRPRVFIGHGKSLLWLEVRDFVRDRLQLDWDEFDRVPVAGHTVTERLSQMLDQAQLALLVLTGDDELRDGKVQARQNVVHEVGLFQGRLGFDRAIVLIEEGCEEFANLAGLVQLRFPKGNVAAVFEKIRIVAEERLLRPQPAVPDS
jgi:hypothetical protein